MIGRIISGVRGFIKNNFQTSVMFLMGYYILYAALMASTGTPIMLPNITVSFLKPMF